MYESSGERHQEQSNSFALGRITRVFPEERLCEVKTFMGTGSTDDNHIPKCQWLALDSHPDGDESSVIPRVGSFGLVFYINTEPFIFGMFAPLTGEGSAQVGETKEELNEGDRVFTTRGGNKIILRAHGEIQIESTGTCRTIYFPDQNLINTLCRNYEFRTDGGVIDWKKSPEGNSTFFFQEFRDNINRSNIILEERGSFSNDENLILRSRIGPGIPGDIGDDVWQRSIFNTGQEDKSVGGGAYSKTINPDGSINLNIAGKTNVSITSDGATTLDVGPGNCVLTVNPDGSVDLKSNATVTVDGSGGQLKLEQNKVALGASGTEVVAEIIEILNAILQMTVPTPLGPSGPPLNSPAFAAILQKLTAIAGNL